MTTAPADTTPGTEDSTPAGYIPPSSQADLDRIINDRLARERAKFADHADLKAKAARLDQIEAANATDLEKAVKAAKAEGENEAATRANARIIKSEARALAAAAQFRDPADAVAFLDLGSVRVSDDGEVDGAAVKGMLDDLAKAKPYLLNTASDGTAGVADSLDLGSRGKPAAASGPASDFASFMKKI
jgi:hypothetical protein